MLQIATVLDDEWQLGCCKIADDPDPALISTDHSHEYMIIAARACPVSCTISTGTWLYDESWVLAGNGQREQCT